jgi:phosphatidylinositol alpha-1,6-mannosyltransferase
VPPGVDGERFHPLDSGERRESRVAFGLDPDRPLVLGLSRLVPRKGFDVVIDAVTGLRGVQLALAGAGRDLGRLERRAIRSGADVTFLGRLPDDDLPRLYGCADAFAMCCRERWAGLEAEGFGIVFLEAAACAVPSVAGHSGGADEAVVDGETGYVVAPRDVTSVRSALDALCRDPVRQSEMGRAARARALGEYSYDHLAARLLPLASGDFSSLSVLPR